MDQLAAFFVMDASSSNPSNDASNCSVAKTKSLCQCIDKHIGCAYVNKSYSTPSFNISCNATAFPQSNSCPGLRDLPLNLPPESEEGNIEYKVTLHKAVKFLAETYQPYSRSFGAPYDPNEVAAK